MFFRREEPKKSFGFSNIARFLISVIVLTILTVGLYQAYKSFSGIDPLSLSPKSVVKNILSSDSLLGMINNILTLGSNPSLDKAKSLLGDHGSGKIEDDYKNSMPLFKFAVFSDSHMDVGSLDRTLKLARDAGAKFVIGLGDFSDVGTIDQLRATKYQLDIAGLPYYVTAGDHDLWDARNKDQTPIYNFNEVFGSAYQSFAYGPVRIILLYNSDNYFGVDAFQLKWLEDELLRTQDEQPKLIFIFTSIPLYHPSSDHVMGKNEPKLKNQAVHITSLLKKSGVDEVFAGDAHFFSRYQEPATGLRMTGVGAVTSERNPQAPRFAIIEIFEGGVYNVKDIEIK